MCVAPTRYAETEPGVNDSHFPPDEGGAKEAPAADASPVGPQGAPRSRQPASFDALYAAHSKAVFRELVAREVRDGCDPIARARDYLERGKPDFVLAFLLVGELPDGEKRELLACAYERRAQLTEEKANDFDRRFHRPFPLLRLEASKDRTLAQRVRAGGTLRPGLGRPLPTI